MKNVLVLGAGRSSSALIGYLLDHASAQEWQVTVGDVSLGAAQDKVRNHSRGKAIAFDIQSTEAPAQLRSADIIVSLLPAHLHPEVARQCLRFGKHLLNASYVSPEMTALRADAASKGLAFICECGLDPGIDHMSAMQVIDRVRSEGGELQSFESFTGGLISPDTDPDNPWRYKFTWNPRNVVMAGQGTARYLRNGKYKYIPYQQLFRRITPIQVKGHGDYEGYANRDSLKYIETYRLEGIQTMIRGTLRNSGFCSAWDVLVQLGCCDDSYLLEGVDRMTHRSFIESFLPEGTSDYSTEERIATALGISSNGGEMVRLRWSGFFGDEPVGLDTATPAQVLEHILNKKWKLKPGDKDQIVMWHRFGIFSGGHLSEIHSTLVATGKDEINTAMAQTVGLPLAIATRLLSEGKIASRGVIIPTTPEFYGPILAELKAMGIHLSEIRVPLS